MDISSANASILLTVKQVFSVPQALEGFGTDDAWAGEETEIANTVVGVDGILSSGYLPALFPMKLTFQADSASIPLTMENWRAAESAARTKYVGSMVIQIPSIGLQYQIPQIVLQRAMPFPAGKKVLAPVSYGLMFTSGYALLPLAI